MTPTDHVWTPEDIQQFRVLWAEGHSTAEIGRRFGVSKNAIVGKAHRLELDSRPSPIRIWPADLPRPVASVKRAQFTLPLLESLNRPVVQPVPQAPTETQLRIARLLRDGGKNLDVQAAVGCSLDAVKKVRATLNLPKRPPSAVVRINRDPDDEPLPLYEMNRPARVIPLMTEKSAKPRGCCNWPMWGDNERPKYHDDGTPLLCGGVIAHGTLCCEHAAIGYTAYVRRAA